MTTIRQLLQEKGGELVTIGPQANVFDAIKTMADRNVGALVVMEGGRMVGLITERIYAREVVLKGRTSPTTPVARGDGDRTCPTPSPSNWSKKSWRS